MLTFDSVLAYLLLLEICTGSGLRCTGAAETGGIMSVLKSKARIITFRVSGEEYEVLSSARLRSGARSLAEFSRAAAFDQVAALMAPSLTLNRDLSTLGKALGDLDVALRAASERINRLLGPADSELDRGRQVREANGAPMSFSAEKS